MGKSAQVAINWTRRSVIALAVLPIVALPGFDLGIGASRASADQPVILMVSRKRLLNDTEHARALLQAENALTAELQHRVDAMKVELTDEEQELTQLRQTLDRSVFAERVAEFDRKLKSQRREAQQLATNLQNVFRAERQKLGEALEPLLEQVRRMKGAAAILNTDNLLAADPALDVTDEAISLFNATMPPPTIPTLEAIAPNTSNGLGGEVIPQ